jgi:glucose-1-phosphate thymidylyltransferase
MKSGTDKSQWKGIVLAGGKGTRLYPLTLACSKQLLPVYDKPMVYHPISTLILGGIRDILIISTPRDMPRFKELLGDGSQLGLNFSYAEQLEANGIAQAFLLGKEFIGKSPVCLILGDNLFHGDTGFLHDALERTTGATVFGYPVSNPERYGVVEFGPGGDVIGIEEKPTQPKSHYAVPGLYCYDNRVAQIAESLQLSIRGELEITDLNKEYLKLGQLRVERLGKGIAWLDMGSPETLLEAGSFVETIEHRQGFKIGCIEESAFRMGFISRDELASLAVPLKDTSYGQHLLSVAEEPE